jgi:PAS domain S-box-containing protein
MTTSDLKQRVQARDLLLLEAEQVRLQDVLQALAQGQLGPAEAAAQLHDKRLAALTENLRIYQTELHVQADELAASQARTEVLLSRFSTLFANMPVAALLVAANGEVLEHNAAAAKLLGLRTGQSSARFMRRLVVGASFQDLVRPAFQQALASGHSLAEEVAFFGENGGLFTGDLHLSRLRDEQSSEGAFACVVIDRSEHLQNLGALQAAVQAREKSETYLADLTERMAMANQAAGIGVWDWDLVQDQIVFDERMTALFGVCPSAGMGLLPTLLGQVETQDAQTLTDALNAIVQNRTPLNLELRLRAPPPGTADTADTADTPSWVHLTGRAHADATNRTVRLVGCAWDTSLQHQAQQLLSAKQAAESASQAKSEFLSRMSHELRTPLNAILGFSQLMQIEAKAGDLVVKPHRVELIESAARHLLDLINEVLDVSRIEAGEMPVRLLACGLYDIVQESLPMVQGHADSEHISLHNHVAKNATWVQADRLRLKEVVINLLSNAVKYNLHGGRVDVYAQPIGGHIELIVVDTGRGMSQEQQAQLFQPFNRLGAENLGIEGTGMGLFVCRRFAQLMGGELQVHSEVGQGTAVKLLLQPAGIPAEIPAEIRTAIRA